MTTRFLPVLAMSVNGDGTPLANSGGSPAGVFPTQVASVTLMDADTAPSYLIALTTPLKRSSTAFSVFARSGWRCQLSQEDGTGLLHRVEVKDAEGNNIAAPFHLTAVSFY